MFRNFREFQLVRGYRNRRKLPMGSGGTRHLRVKASTLKLDPQANAEALRESSTGRRDLMAPAP